MSAKQPTYRVLVADDERSVLEAYRTVLSGLNPDRSGDDLESLEAELFGKAPSATDAIPHFEALICRGGEEAVEAVRVARKAGESFPVAFLDVRMPPGIDGIETAGRIRAMDPDINIVMVTAHADSHPREIAERVPPLDKLFYITKPFQATEVQQFVLALTARWNAERQLRSTNRELTLRCLELEATQAQLRAARERAEHASRSKSEFLANMSHELRTPLNAVIGFTDVMRTESYGPIANERYKQYLDDISHSSTHLLRVISDLLDFSKIEAGKLEMYREDIAVDELVEGVVAMMRQEAERSRVALRLEKGTPQTILSADPHRLRQVLLNLLSNAIKFTPAAGEVQACTVMQPDGDVSIVVTDTGIGMAEADIEHALEPFGQVEQGLARKYQGTGLGLPLAKRLAELQGATLEIASAPQKGTTVVVTFPAGFVTEYTPSNRNSVRQSVA
jgi:signal transduction histidine kinase